MYFLDTLREVFELPLPALDYDVQVVGCDYYAGRSGTFPARIVLSEDNLFFLAVSFSLRVVESFHLTHSELLFNPMI